LIKAKAALSYPSQFFEVSKPKTLASFDRSPTNARTHREEQDNGTSNRITSRPKYHILLFDFRLSGIKGVQARRHRPPFQRSTANFNQCARFVLLSRAIELELELIQSHMAQKPVLRGEVGCACVAPCVRPSDNALPLLLFVSVSLVPIRTCPSAQYDACFESRRIWARDGVILKLHIPRDRLNPASQVYGPHCDRHDSHTAICRYWRGGL